jgi:GT2 family glycosyltransferase
MPIPIIVVNWNGIEDTVECMSSLIKLDHNDYHIYLIDNNSDNDEGERLYDRYNKDDNISVLLNDDNLGFTGAHIDIWEKQFKDDHTIEYLALINNDTAVESNWLTALCQTAQSTDASIISSKMINYYNRDKMDNAGHKMISTGEILPVGHGESIHEYNIEMENLGACAGACLYSASMLREIGFFDPYFSTGYEDAELGLRAIIANHQSMYSPEAVVYHKMGQSISKIFDERYSLMIHHSILYSYFKLMPRSILIKRIPSFIFKYFAIFIIDIISLRFGYLKIHFKAWKKLWTNKALVIEKRRNFYYKAKEIRDNSEIQRRIESFLWFDIKRFWKYFVLRKRSSFDNYTNDNE